MTKYILTLVLLIFGLNAYSTSHEQIQKIAETVLTELYEIHGNTSIAKPSIVVTDDDKEVASFRRRSNSILLSTKAFSICQSFDEDFLSALAFIIGHELAHAYQSEFIHGTTGFLAHSAHPETREHLENEADIQGILLAYLAGYETTELLPDLMKRIYTRYDLMGKILSGYPSYSERQAKSEEVILLANRLFEIFEAANYLTVIGKHELAAHCFEYIKNYYQGQEIFNNLGVNYALHALNLTDENIEPFVYPFELDWNTRLRKPSNHGGVKDLNPYERRLREKYLTKAQSAFKKVLKNNPQNHAARINLMSVYNLRGDYMAAMNEYEKEEWYMASQEDMASANLVLAVSYFRVGNKEKAHNYFSRLSRNKDKYIAALAACNLESLTGTNICKNDFEACPFIEDERTLVRPVNQKTEKENTPIILDEREETSLIITENNQYKRLIFSHKQKNIIVLSYNLNTTTTTEKNNLKPENLKHALHTSTGLLIPCPEQRMIYRLANDHTVLEKVWY